MNVRSFVIGVVLAASAVLTPAALAGTSCGYQGSQTFAPWGDESSYTQSRQGSLFPGGDFETGTTGWNAALGATVIDTDSNRLLDPSGTHSLEIPGGAIGLSAMTCVDRTTPTMRFFLRRVGGSGDLHVAVLRVFSRKWTTIATITGGTEWAASPVIDLPAWGLTRTAGVQFAWTTDAGSTYRVDDVYLDPFRCC